MRALVVEDDERVSRLNKRLLEAEGFQVDVAPTVPEANRRAQADNYDFVMLDMVLPGGSGMEVLATIRERSRTTPVLIVSGLDDIAVTVSGLDAGADDYLHKPYEPEELSARIRALLRRSGPALSPTLQCGNLILNRVDRNASVGSGKLDLTAKEFALLEYFLLNPGKTISRAELLEKVWRFDFDPGTNIVDVNISRVRAKLTRLAAVCRIESERGVGYVLTGH